MECNLNIVGCLLLIVSVFLFGLKGMATEMGIAVAASAVFLAFANLDKFSKFKGAGFEAELREVVTEANATIEHLKSVTTPLLITSIDLMTKDGRWSDGDGINKCHDQFDKLVSLESEIGVTDSALDLAKQKYIRIHAWDMISELAKNIERAGEAKFTTLTASKVGRHSFDKTPDLTVFKELLVSIELDSKLQEQLKKVENYYFKYKL
ncbi:hypothetical protein V4V55_003905 [Vibrio mimicus]